MFNKKKKETPSKTSLIPSTTSHSLNSLVSGTFVEGTINSDSDIRIDGTIKGNLNCKAKVIIGPNGRIEGSVKCSNAVIEGKFSGNISVTNLLHIKESAHIEGDVITGKLIVQEGAAFNVTCKMSGPDSNTNGILKPKKHSNSIVQQAAKAGSI